MTRSDARRTAFTIVELFAVLILISTLISLLLPAVQSAREMARRTSCANNLMQVGLAVRGYHAAFGQFPTQLSGTDGSAVAGQDNDRRLSIFVALLPYIDRDVLAEQIPQPQLRTSSDGESSMMGMAMGDMGGMAADLASEGQRSRGNADAKNDWWVAGGPEPFEMNYIPWISEQGVLRCPSDPGVGGGARSNYAACIGDGLVAGDSGPMKEVKGLFVLDANLAAQTEAAMRGLFVPRVVTRITDVRDGLSNTIMLGEICTGLGDTDIRTHPAEGPGVKVLRDNPNWARGSELIDADRPNFWRNGSKGSKLDNNIGFRRGHRWADGMPLYTSVNTILPPNRELVLHSDRDDCWGTVPPSSRHQGGVNVCFGDSAVRFVSDSIDAGDARQATVYLGSVHLPGSESPFGLWGALGTRANSELKANSVPSSDGAQ